MKAGIKTTEWWTVVAIAPLYALLTLAFPDLPTEPFYAMCLYILSRFGVKAVEAKNGGG